MKKNVVLFYGIPAYGHVYSNLYLAGRLAKTGVPVIYYSTETLRMAIEANGCLYRPYPICQETLDLTDGKKILKLYRLILQYTQEMLPALLKDAKKILPCGVIFESLALWGRAISDMLSLPSFSFYSIAAIHWPKGNGFFAYARGFSGDFLSHTGEILPAMRLKFQLKRRYPLKKLGLLPVLMNKGTYNLMGYSRRFQPGGKSFGNDYLFLGPLASHRHIIEANDFACPDKPFIYVSLGTVFNQDPMLVRELVRQFGQARGGPEKGGGKHTANCPVILVWDGKAGTAPIRFPPNFIVRPFVNQAEIFPRASLFITAGGVNSIHEALSHGVPCLLCPQQGEQFLNARQFEKMGFGKILKNPASLYQEAQETIRLKDTWDKTWQQEMTSLHINRALWLIRRCCLPQTPPGPLP